MLPRLTRFLSINTDNVLIMAAKTRSIITGSQEDWFMVVGGEASAAQPVLYHDRLKMIINDDKASTSELITRTTWHATTSTNINHIRVSGNKPLFHLCLTKKSHLTRHWPNIPMYRLDKTSFPHQETTPRSFGLNAPRFELVLD